MVVKSIVSKDNAIAPAPLRRRDGGFKRYNNMTIYKNGAINIPVFKA